MSLDVGIRGTILDFIKELGLDNYGSLENKDEKALDAIAHENGWERVLYMSDETVDEVTDDKEGGGLGHAARGRKKNPIGGMTVFKITEKSIVLFYSMFDYTYQRLQPITLLMQYIISWAKKNEIQFIDYGISNQPKTKGKLALNTSLIKFKEEFGCFSSIRNTYRKSI